MGKLKNIEIYFENNKNVYYPGDTIRGNILVESKGEIKINALKVYIRGVAKVHWTETKTAGYRLGNYTEHYRSEIEYICLKQQLIGGKEISKNNYLKEFICDGHHIFPFNFTLPRSGMVTSFEGKCGSIRYFLKAELDKPWTLNHKLKKLFTVINPIDINQREFTMPIFNECSKTLCCWLCASGPISINVKTDRRGYCPGEAIVLNAFFENNGNRNVIPNASLYQIQTYNASGKHFIQTSKLVAITGSSVPAKSSHEWNAKLIKIPAVSPTIGSVLIKVEYFVKVSLLIPGSYSLSCVLPIIIGTVPYRRNQSPSVHYQMMPTAHNLHDAPPAYSDIASRKTKDRGGGGDDENGDDDEFNANFFPLYTYVSDYVPPPPYSCIELDEKGDLVEMIIDESGGGENSRRSREDGLLENFSLINNNTIM